MSDKTQKILVVLLVLGAAASLITFLVGSVERVGETFALQIWTSGDATILDEDTNVFDAGAQMGTSSVRYFDDGTTATSSLVLFTERANRADLNLLFNASSSASILLWNYTFSNNGIDWFGEDTYTVTNDRLITHGAATTTHSWAPGVENGAVLKNVSIPIVASKYTKIDFNVDGADGALWAQVVAKEPSN